MTFKPLRRGSAKCIGLITALLTIVVCLYYISIGQTNDESPPMKLPSDVTGGDVHGTGSGGFYYKLGSSAQTLWLQTLSKPTPVMHNEQFASIQKQLYQRSNLPHQSPQSRKFTPMIGDIAESGSHLAVDAVWGAKCYTLLQKETNITAKDQFAKFEFQPEWMRAKEYWDRGFEERFEVQKHDKQRHPLRIYIVPHSHNDPGWLKTFTNYFQSDSRQILNFVINKMQDYTDMTFIWTEISFLQLWWDQAHPTKQRALKRLIQSGRFEITTGGWVMSDEANVHIYALLDQLVEGHQWLRHNLNITPTVGWSIDPFGHGSTVPYLLSGSNFKGAIIQRIHYAWKEWFARQQSGDFIWKPYWQLKGAPPSHYGNLLVHNMPFDIYSIKGSCGPHPFICLNFDFRKIPGEYTEYSVKAQFITKENVQEKSQLLLEQYARTASLFSHNVALIPVGDDFRYNKEIEIDQQYKNYKMLIDHIMANKHIYNANISFGTPNDYFDEILKRSDSFPTFKGDFFVYSDIFSEGKPAYWSGYYTTRPFYKLLSSDLEHNLRAAEIIFTVAYNTARKRMHESSIKILEKNYEKIIHARRNLGLFQHHDAITGTSKAAVMRDYGMRLFESIQGMVKMQETTIELLLQYSTSKHRFILSELERENFNKLPRKLPLQLAEPATFAIGSSAPNSKSNRGQSAKFVVYNSLAQKRVRLISIYTQHPFVKVLNSHGEIIHRMQINPVWNITTPYDPSVGVLYNTKEQLRMLDNQFEVIFVTELEPLSLTTFTVINDKVEYKRFLSHIYCNDCLDDESPTPRTTSKPRVNEFNIKSKPTGDIQLENEHMKLLLDEKSGFLKTVTRKSVKDVLTGPILCQLKFAAYRSAQFHSAAYLFKTDPEQSDAEKDVLEQYEQVRIIVTAGPVASSVTVMYGQFLTHTVRILNSHTHLDAAIYIENEVDFETPPKNRETELFMRFLTNIDNIAPQRSRQDVLENSENNQELPIFYSDQNGFQFHERIKVPSIGIEGNYFPITTAGFIQDKNVRLTLLTTHAQGAASFEPGQLEVMLDRRTLYDDYRGMGEGILDNRLTRHAFWLLFECMPEKNTPNSYQVLSIQAQQLSNDLLYPANIYFVDTLDVDVEKTQLNPLVRFLSHHPMPCDVHLMNLRTLSDDELQLFPSQSALLVLHRQGIDCSISARLVDMSNICTLSDKGLGQVGFNTLHVQSIEKTSLTGLQSKDERKSFKSFAELTLNPMDIGTFNITFKT